MRKTLIASCLTMLFSTPALAAPVSADDFVAPVTATPEQQSSIRQVQGQVSTTQDPATQTPVISAQTAQDAINYAAQDCVAGTDLVQFPSGVGLVTTGIGGYEKMDNLNAMRIARRNAYVRAFMEAKAKMAEYLNGMRTEGVTRISEQLQQYTDADSTLINFSTNQDERLKQTVSSLLKGFVVYDVRDVPEKHQVCVTLVVTPKTLGKVSRPNSTDIKAQSIREGLQQVLNEVQQGVLPPVGTRVVFIEKTGELAFVGYGSSLISTHDNPVLRSKLKTEAQTIAQMRARDALAGAIIGDQTKMVSQLDGQTRGLIEEFQNSGVEDAFEVEKIQQARKGFVDAKSSSVEIQSIRDGQLPPGVNIKTFFNAEDSEAIAVAVYIPSASAQAGQLANDMLNAPNAGVAGNSANALTTPAKKDQLEPGPSGQVTQNKDL